MWWAVPLAIAAVAISIGVPMMLDYLAEKKEDKNNDR